MNISDADIERAINKRLTALEELPIILMPFDPESEDSSNACESITKHAN